MNLFEMLAFLMACYLAFLFGSVLSAKIGLIGWIIGVLLGFLTPMLIVKGIQKIMDKLTPLYPQCSNGKCSSKDYKFQKWIQAGAIFVCSCGNFYVLSKGRFFEMVSETELRPYMKKNWWGKWQPDKAK